MAERVSGNSEANGGARWSILENVPKVEDSKGGSAESLRSESGQEKLEGAKRKAFRDFLKLNGKTKGNTREGVLGLSKAELTELRQQFESYWDVVGEGKTGGEVASGEKKNETERSKKAPEGLRAYLETRGLTPKDFQGMTEDEKKAFGNEFREFQENAEERRADFGKYLSAHGMTREDVPKMTKEQQLALADDFEEYRRMKAERMDYLGKQLDEKKKGNVDFYIEHNMETVRREMDFRAKKVREERDGIQRSVDRMERVQSDEARREKGEKPLTEGQRDFVKMSLDRERKKLKKAEKRLQREESNAEKYLTKEQKENIERAEENVRRFQEQKRLYSAEQKMWESGADRDKIKYSVEQKRVIDESALLTKMNQEYQAIPTWKFGERRAMKKRIERQRETVKQAVDMLMAAQAEKKKQGKVGESEKSVKSADTRRMVDVRRPKHMGSEKKGLKLVNNSPKHMRREDEKSNLDNAA